MTNTREIPAITLTSSAAFHLSAETAWYAKIYTKDVNIICLQALTLNKLWFLEISRLSLKILQNSSQNKNIAGNDEQFKIFSQQKSPSYLNTVLSPPLKLFDPKKSFKNVTISIKHFQRFGIPSPQQEITKVHPYMTFTLIFRFLTSALSPNVSTHVVRSHRFSVTFISRVLRGCDSLRALKFLRDGNLDSGILRRKRGHRFCCLQYFTPWLIIWSGWR